MGQTFRRDRRNRGPVSQQLFHKKDSLPAQRSYAQRPAFCGFISNVTSTLTIFSSGVLNDICNEPTNNRGYDISAMQLLVLLIEVVLCVYTFIRENFCCKVQKNVAPKSEKSICHIKATYSAFKRDNFVFKSRSLKRNRKNNTTMNFIFHTYFWEILEIVELQFLCQIN